MLKYTDNLKLLKPDDDDIYDIDHMNQNADVLDKEITKIYNVLGGDKGDVIEQTKKSIRNKKNIKIPKTLWTKSGSYYVATIKDSSVTNDNMVNVNIHKQYLHLARFMLPVTESNEGKFTLFSYSPLEDDIYVDYSILTEVM